ncbi:MAG TPA: PIN domain-containing protein, partial [Bellilinea sp.]|nr:PIN domain-containing protein [Bellilinea sp.]
LDTNILVYAYDRSAGQKHDLAVQVMESCWENENGCLSIQVLQEFFVTVTRKLATPLDHQTARQIVADLAQWRFHAPDTGDLLQAIDLQRDLQLSFWDAQVVQSAISLGCAKLLSEDLSHGQMYGSVQVINPLIKQADTP